MGWKTDEGIGFPPGLELFANAYPRISSSFTDPSPLNISETSSRSEDETCGTLLLEAVRCCPCNSGVKESPRSGEDCRAGTSEYEEV
jgi:hypothetical protein